MRIVLIVFMLSTAIVAQSPSKTATPDDTQAIKTVAPTLTREESLLQQVAQLQAQLSQAQSAAASCEANGPASLKTAQAYQSTVQALMKSLDARGLVMDPQTGAISEKPKSSEPKK